MKMNRKKIIITITTVAAIIIVIMVCNIIRKLNESFPLTHLGDNKDSVRNEFGEPDKSHQDEDVYRDITYKGITGDLYVYYEDNDDIRIACWCVYDEKYSDWTERLAEIENYLTEIYGEPEDGGYYFTKHTWKNHKIKISSSDTETCWYFDLEYVSH